MEKKERPGFLQEDNGSKSSIRLMSVISLVAAIGFGFLTIQTASANPANAMQVATPGLYITGMFVLGAFAPKALQKFMEKGPVVPK